MQNRVVYGVVAFLVGVAVTTVALTTDIIARLAPSAARADSDLYAPRDWSRSSASRLNISSFAFADRDRSDSYTHGDRPMAGIAMRLTRPDGSSVIRRSNINGFINFGMRLGSEEDDIARVGGVYRFELIPPPGWEITTDNAVHETAFRAIPGAIAGIGAVDPPPVVGLARAPMLSGDWPRAAAGPLIAIGNDGSEHRIRLDGRGHFEATLAPGIWTLEDSTGLSRRVEIGFAPVHLGRGSSFANAGLSRGAARTVDFDDNDRSDIEKLAPGYAGLGWDYLLAVDNQYYEGPGYVNGLVSGSRVAYNSSGHPVTISATTPGELFDFVGGFFSTAWPQAEGETLRIRAYRDALVVAEDVIALSHLGPVYFQADYVGVTRVEFTTTHYWQFVVDDLRVRVDPAGGTRPAPGTPPGRASP